MTRTYKVFEVENVDGFKQQMLNWGNRFNICCLLDNQQYQSGYHSYECLLAAGVASRFVPSADYFASLSSFIETNNDWIFGHFSYEVGARIEEVIPPRGEDNAAFPDSFLFVPQVVLILKDNQLTIGSVTHLPEAIFSEIKKEDNPLTTPGAIDIKQRISRDQYIESVNHLKKHIHQGDCYEINFCQQFYGYSRISPASVFTQLIKTSPNPFSAFYRVDDHFLLCASPERFLKKTGNKIISQPIKGTSARNIRSAEDDELNKRQLQSSTKDRSENVMIVDLVRNDLSKICEEGTVRAEELFGVYSFPQVHQMISTITGILKNDIDFADVLKATFPMGSMTGAPKKKVMQLIGKYEEGKRGIYSGTIGYFTPDKDFDFNVVIRSIVYNDKTGYLSFHTGSAITASSDPDQEYEECLLKAKAILDVFCAIAEA